MKKMLPAYVLLLALLGALIFSIHALDKRLNAIQGELAGIRSEQLTRFNGRAPRQVGEGPLLVEVTNTPLEVEVQRQGQAPCHNSDREISN
jgi:hypothetical protein